MRDCDTASRDANRVRRRVEVRGIVQGVGFRPFVYRLARELRLDGWVRNDAAGVTIEVEGDPSDVDALARRLEADAPALARVDAVTVCDAAGSASASGFAIVDSDRGRTTTAIGPDSAICADCLAELFDPSNRRYRYAFVNCTNCGPRYTISRALPYDRAQTSMAAFAQCARCEAEYRDPAHRRFHAEPNACPRCGPRLWLVDASGRAIGGDPIAATVERIASGGIVAIKGLGGFHLACDARAGKAVAELRRRKSREEKPFAVMVAGCASVERYAFAGAAERAWLQSAERPIVLLEKKAGADDTLAGVAPGLAWLGAMLPYTPLHYLLFHEAAGRPLGTRWLDEAQPLVLVMTSANPGGEPLVTGNDEALARLAGIADALLMHDRDVVVRCDDSVVRALGDGRRPQFFRRARGFTPRAIRLARSGPPIVSTGGYFKNTGCVTRAGEAFVSQHVGDLDNAATCEALERTLAHLVESLDVEPAAIAHDLHPDFFSTRLATALAQRYGVRAIAVQHHHAHVAAVAAEHRFERPLLGLALDGVGLGDDGAAWGGELLRIDGARCTRLAHLSPLALPGGDRAAREPWRMAASALAAIGRGEDIARRFGDEPAATTVATMLARGVRAPRTTSMGRWFDAAAGLLGVQRRTSFEGQAAMRLEGLAAAHGRVAADLALFAIRDDGTLDLAPLAARLADTDDAAFGAALFHATLVEALARWVALAAAREGVDTVACGGGVFLNAIVARGLRAALASRGLAMLEAEQVPPGDGGLSLGQAWVARCALEQGLLRCA